MQPPAPTNSNDPATPVVKPADMRVAVTNPSMSATMAVEVERLEDQIRKLEKQVALLSRMATIGELTSTTTHEFNNLLMTIVNYAQLGQRRRDDETRDKALARIGEAANRATKITGSILAMAKSKSGQMEPTDLKQLLEDTLLLLEREFRKYRVNLSVELREVPEVLAIANELQRVVINLLVNARQATPEAGEVRLTLESDSEKNEVVLSIRDTGSGIEADNLPKIFEPFFTTKDGPDQSGRGGTGLGLSSCKEIIDAHRGRIRVETAVGKGTAFIIRFPAKLS